MKIDSILVWNAFLGVATQGNFSAASRKLKVPIPQLSKRVAQLESQLGVRLFQRTTRVVTLTDEGRLLVPKIESILEDLNEAESYFENSQNLSGTVKVTCVPFVANKLLLPVLDNFVDANPNIHLELDLSEKFVDIIDAGFDMAIRIETPRDSELVYRKLAPNDLIFCASPEYLKKNRSPIRHPSDLLNHKLLMLGIHHRCRFTDQTIQLGHFRKTKVFSSSNGDFLTLAALQGLGVLVRSIWDVQEHLKSGSLIQVLPKYPLETFGYIHAVVPSKRFLAPRVRAFLNFVIQASNDW